MLLWSTQVNAAVFGVFLTLELTEIILFIGNFSASTGTVKFGGWVGIVTARPGTHPRPASPTAWAAG